MIATLGFITSTFLSFGFKYKHKYLSKCKYICKTVKNELVAHCVELLAWLKTMKKYLYKDLKTFLSCLSDAVSGCCLVCERFMTLHLEFGLQPTSASCQGSSPNLLLVEHLQDLFIATEASVEQCSCV